MKDGLAARGDEKAFGPEDHFAGIHYYLPVFHGYALDLCAVVYGYALVPEDLLQDLGRLGVADGDEVRVHVDHGDLRPKACEGLGHFGADGSPADDGEGRGHFLELEHVCVRQDAGDLFYAGDGRDEGLRPRAYEDLFRSVILAPGADSAVVDEFGLFLDQVDLFEDAHHLLVVDVVDLCPDDAHGVEVVEGEFGADAVLFEAPGSVERLAGLEQGLAGDAAAVEAFAADLVFFKRNCFKAHGGSHGRYGHARRAHSYNHEVVFFHVAFPPRVGVCDFFV